MSSEFFLDTSYVIALVSPRDKNHAQALTLAQEIEKSGSKIITSRAVLLEIGNALSRPQYRQAAVRLLSSLEADKNIGIVPISDELWGEAFQLFQARSDKSWGMVDCISFVIMDARGIEEALTADSHFAQAGFEPLLR